MIDDQTIKNENVSVVRLGNADYRNKIFLSLKQKLIEAFADFPEEKTVIIKKNKFPLIVLDFVVPGSSFNSPIEELFEEMEVGFSICHKEKEDFALILTMLNKFVTDLKQTNTVSFYQYYFYDPDKNFIDEIMNDKNLDEKSKKEIVEGEMYGLLNFWERNEDWITYDLKKLKKILAERTMFKPSRYYSRKNNQVYSIRGLFCLNNKNPKIQVERTPEIDLNSIEVIRYDQDEFMEIINLIRDLISEKLDAQSIEKINKLIELNKDNFIDLNDEYILYFIYFKFGNYCEDLKNEEESHHYYNKCKDILEKLKKENDNLYDEDEYNELLEKLKD